MLLPLADDAASWFVEAAHAALMAGERLDAGAVELLMRLAPDDTSIAAAIDSLARGTASDEPRTVATLADAAREAAAKLRDAVATRDEALARAIVTALETELLRVYRPSRGLGRFEDDAAVALAMLAAYDIGGDEAHLMMAEELMLGLVRREWHTRARHGLAANCEAAVALAALAARTGKAEYRERALDVLREYAATYRDWGVRAAPYVAALRLVTLEP